MDSQTYSNSKIIQKTLKRKNHKKDYMKVRIPPKTLKVLRESMGLSLQELSQSANIPIDELQRVESRGGEISYGKLKKIATILKYPIASFFIHSTKLPKIKPPTDRREGYLNKRVSYETMKVVKKVYLIQDYISEKLQKVRLPLRASLSKPPWEVAKVYRKAMGLSADMLRSFKKPNEAFEYFRKTLLVKFHIYTLQIPLNLEELRGFVLIEEGKIPIIVVNSKDSDEAKLFTLFHELGHIVLGESRSFFDYPDPLGDKTKNRIEIWCNNFAASMLLPKEEISKLVENVSHEDWKKIVRDISRKLNISKSFVLIQLIKSGYLDKGKAKALFRKEIEKFDPLYILEKKKSKSEKEGGPSFVKKLVSQLGKEYIEGVLSDYKGKHITVDRALELLSIKTSVKAKTMKKLMRGALA